jgi:hypothetical protein
VKGKQKYRRLPLSPAEGQLKFQAVIEVGIRLASQSQQPTLMGTLIRFGLSLERLPVGSANGNSSHLGMLRPRTRIK